MIGAALDRRSACSSRCRDESALAVRRRLPPPWRNLIAFAIVAAFVGVLAAIAPARRASRLNVLPRPAGRIRPRMTVRTPVRNRAYWSHVGARGAPGATSRLAESLAPSTNRSSSTRSSTESKASSTNASTARLRGAIKEHHADHAARARSLALSIPLIAVAGAQAGAFGVAMVRIAIVLVNLFVALTRR